MIGRTTKTMDASRSRRFDDTTSELNVSLNALNVTLANQLDISRIGFRVFELRSFDWIDPLTRTSIAMSWMLH